MLAAGGARLCPRGRLAFFNLTGLAVLTPWLPSGCWVQVEHFFAPEAAFEEEERLRKEREERAAAEAATADPPAEVGVAWG